MAVTLSWKLPAGASCMPVLQTASSPQPIQQVAGLALAAKPRAKLESLLAFLTLLVGEFRVVKYSIAAQHVVVARVPVLV
jgi:hypothetical protein